MYFDRSKSIWIEHVEIRALRSYLTLELPCNSSCSDK